MEVTIEIDGVRHRMVETEKISYCNGAMSTTPCSLLPMCIGANRCASQASILKFCNLFPHEAYAHFEHEEK